MRKFAAMMLPFLAVGVLVLAGCGKSAATSSTSTSTSTSTAGGGGAVTSTIGMDTSNFTTHAATVQANQPVTFDDTVSGGGVHFLCIGTGNGGAGASACDKSGSGPSQLYPTASDANGYMISPGQKPQITFTTPGTYHVICTVHPGMYVDVTVQ